METMASSITLEKLKNAVTKNMAQFVALEKLKNAFAKAATLEREFDKAQEDIRYLDQLQTYSDNEKI